MVGVASHVDASTISMDIHSVGNDAKTAEDALGMVRMHHNALRT